MRPKAATKGIALLEVMFGIAVIGTLASVAIPSYLLHLRQARATVCQANRETVNREIMAYLATRDEQPESLSAVGYPDSLCPSGGVYVLDSYGEDFGFPTVACSLHGYDEMPVAPGALELSTGGLRIRQDSENKDYVQEFNASSLFRTGYLPIDGGVRYTLDEQGWDAWEDHPRHPRVYFFDENRNYIGYGAAFESFQSPAAAAFLRIRIGVAEGETPGPLRLVICE